MHDQREGHVVGTANTVDVVLDIAEHEYDLVEVAQVIDHFQFSRWHVCRGGSRAGRRGSGKNPAER